jgi:Cysteine-rich secretory protein family
MALTAAILTIVVALSVLRPLPAVAATTSFTTAAERIVSDTNVFRAAHGLSAVSLDLTISDDVAQPWAQKMAQTGSFNHNPNVSAQIPAGWSAWGENIAYGFDYTDVVDAWIASPEHRANLLGDFSDLGIGYAVDASGTAWLVQDFATYPNTTSKTGGSTPASSAKTASTAAASAGTTTTTQRTSVSRGAAVAHKGKKAARIHGLKVRNASNRALRVSGSTKAHSTLRVKINGPKNADVRATLHTDRHGRFALVWNGSGRVGTYAITVKYVANKHYAPAYSAWSMTFTRTP